MSDQSVDEPDRSIFDAAAHQVVFLSGAGISADPPTCGPVGLGLTYRALEHAFLDETLEEVRAVYEAVWETVSPGTGTPSVPRLEAVLEIAVQVHGAVILETLLRDLLEARPNPLHRFFNRHLCLGGRHITANFDTLIEGDDPDRAPVHFHGALGHGNDSWARLGARLSTLERGFDASMRAELRNTLLIGDVRAVVVVGYSGLDYFDMDPFIASIAGELALRGTRVIWMFHDPAALPGRLVQSTGSDSDPPLLRELRRTGVRVTKLHGLTSTLLDHFARRWGIPPLEEEAGTAVRQDHPDVPYPARAEATRRLYLHMGMFRSHEQLLRRCAFLRAKVDLAGSAEIAWQKGNYSEARSRWDLLHAGRDGASGARRLERRAAVLWVRGSYLRAYNESRRSLALAQRSGKREVVGAALEMQARILLHAARTPELRWFSTAKRRRELAARILRETREDRFGTHLTKRLDDVITHLASGAREAPRSAVVVDAIARGQEAFEQYESLSAVLDYRRGLQRAEVEAGITSMTSEWLESYQQAATALGKEEAVRSSVTLPGAASLLPLRESLHLIATSSATLWHRCRLISWLVAARLRGAPRVTASTDRARRPKDE